ncbi:hypothetical protein [Herminiimonas aquatilis]|uniref:Uncharacterized protein n=1 Tax=Herminiimonas aquatilis TaxID=345342 RepID=A0ABW2J6G0_9BURK
MKSPTSSSLLTSELPISAMAPNSPFLATNVLMAAPVVTPTAAAMTITSPTTPDLNSPLVTADALANGFATLVGALLGALLAYWFQTRVLRKQEQKSALLSAHRTMFSLLQQINTILLIQRDFVFKELENPVRFISIQPTSPFDPNKNVLNVNDLSFLLDTAEGRTVLLELYIAQENYVEAINHWNLRSNTHVQQLQPALVAAGILPNAMVNIKSFEAALGPLLLGTMVNTTDNSLLALRRAFKKLTLCKDKVRAYAVRRFKRNDFTDFDCPDTWGLTEKKSTESE